MCIYIEHVHAWTSKTCKLIPVIYGVHMLGSVQPFTWFGQNDSEEIVCRHPIAPWYPRS